MTNKEKVQYVLLLVVFLIALACSTSGKKDKKSDAADTTTATYVGSKNCEGCHSTIYNNFIKSGHKWILNKVENGQPPSYPYSNVTLTLPAGYEWKDISYVLGGYGWKAYYLDTTGKIIGLNKGYSCGKCHTSGYSEEGSQDNLSGITGTWKELGVTCERCHGNASKHIAKSSNKPTVDKSIELCGECHNKNRKDKVEAKDGFIYANQQYEEIKSGAHKNHNCSTCHDPHISAKNSPQDAIIRKCIVCHSDKSVISAGMEDIECVDCHMPYIAKIANKVSAYKADLRSHLFRVNSDSTANMFETINDTTYAKNFITLDYVCLTCHSDKTIGWAAENAEAIHPE
ncbi:MAG: hypothetical protein HY934_03745 [Candidatus Firestonebacteria bacterium]|nr:hypothetical protein [Candidatus Firestonebacteria bacterium]